MSGPLSGLRRGFRAALGGALLLALAIDSGRASAAASNDDAPAGDVAATWKKNAVELHYQALTTRYSCEGLKQKVRVLLLYFGAREDGLRLRTYGCAGGPYRPSPVVNFAADFETLQPADPGSAGTVAARWVERSLFARTRVSRNAPSYITRGDCELVQKFVAVLLPAFAHQTISDLTRCIPHELDGTMPNLRVRVLMTAADATGVPPL